MIHFFSVLSLKHEDHFLKSSSFFEHTFTLMIVINIVLRASCGVFLAMPQQANWRALWKHHSIEAEEAFGTCQRPVWPHWAYIALCPSQFSQWTTLWLKESCGPPLCQSVLEQGTDSLPSSAGLLLFRDPDLWPSCRNRMQALNHLNTCTSSSGDSGGDAVLICGVQRAARTVDGHRVVILPHNPADDTD